MARITYTGTGDTEKIVEAISIEKFERSITRISKEIEDQEKKKKALLRAGVRRSMKEELEDITVLDSILSPYELIGR